MSERNVLLGAALGIVVVLLVVAALTIRTAHMSLNAWIGLFIVLIPLLLVASIAGAVRICLWVMDDGGSEHSAGDGP
jgi:hypothetical protein